MQRQTLKTAQIYKSILVDKRYNNLYCSCIRSNSILRFLGKGERVSFRGSVAATDRTRETYIRSVIGNCTIHTKYRMNRFGTMRRTRSHTDMRINGRTDPIWLLNYVAYKYKNIVAVCTLCWLNSVRVCVRKIE